MPVSVYINDNENVPKIGEILNTVDNNETEFVECPLHTPENLHLKH